MLPRAPTLYPYHLLRPLFLVVAKVLSAKPSGRNRFLLSFVSDFVNFQNIVLKPIPTP